MKEKVANQGTSKNQKDLLQTMINSSSIVERHQDRTPDTLSYQDLVDEFSTFFVAGMDTTGHWLGIALYTLTIVIIIIISSTMIFKKRFEQKLKKI